MSLRDKLRKLRREEGERPPPPPAPEVETLEGASSDAPRGLEDFEGALGPWQARRTSFDATHRHGDFGLDEIVHVRGEDFARLTGDDALAELDLREAVYLDTETTGLSGGAGTYVFMVGLGAYRSAADAESEGGDFEVWQGFLPSPAEEAALLAECAERIRAASSVVSFFGKSFDRHRLEDKMRACGVTPPFDALPHLDLYHPLRRLYRDAYVDGRLKTLEAELCGLARADDLPGALAPAAWFDFLAGREHRLEGVFRHNLDDVLSLVTLAAHLGRTSAESRGDGSALPGDAAARAVGYARSAAARGERDLAGEWYERALARGARPTRGLRLERAHQYRLGKQPEAALAAYRELADGPEDACSAPALLELAKLLEHHARDPRAALACCEAARALLDRQHSGSDRARLARDLERRDARLRARS